MTLIVTGPESSGTRLLHRVVTTADPAAAHRSMPHGRDWTLPLGPGDEVLAIRREHSTTVASAVRAGHAPTPGVAAMRRYAALFLIREQTRAAGVRLRWVDYEDLVADPDSVLAELRRWYGLHCHVPEPLHVVDTTYAD